MSRSIHFSRPQAAFSLVELMVVVVLIGILTAAIIPEMRGTYDDALLKSAARRLVAAFDVAYSHAISRNEDCRFEFDRSTGRYFISEAESEIRAVPGPQGSRMELPGGQGKVDSRISVRVRPLQDGSSQMAAAPGDAAGDREYLQPENLAAAQMAEQGTPESSDSADDASDSGKSGAAINPRRNRATTVSITFYADGTADGREVVLEGREGDRLALVINPSTARVSIREMEAAK